MKPAFKYKISLILVSLFVFQMLGDRTPGSAKSFSKAVDVHDLDASMEGLLPTVEGVLEGFDDTLPGTQADLDIISEMSKISLHGHLALHSAYNYSHVAPTAGQTDWRGFSSLRLEFLTELKIDLSQRWKGFVSGSAFIDLIYPLNGRDNYTDQVLEAYAQEAEIKEFFLEGTLFQDVDLKLGRQIVVWGKSDNIRVTDVLNPLDMREPGLTDLEDLRLPVFMSRLDYYFDKTRLSALAVHEFRFNKEPVYGSDFFPYDRPLPGEKIPVTNLKNTQWALAANGIFDKWEMSVNLARIYDDQAHMTRSPGPEDPAPYLEHASLTMVGSSFGLVLGNFLFKAEAAFFDGIRYFNVPDTRFSRIDILGGLEYSGFKEAFISIEAANRHVNNWTHTLEHFPDYVLKDDFQTALRISKEFLHNTLTLTFLGSFWGTRFQNGGFQRYEAEYDVSDALSITAGAIDYQSGEKFELKDIGNNDRIFFKLRYRF